MTVLKLRVRMEDSTVCCHGGEAHIDETHDDYKQSPELYRGSIMAWYQEQDFKLHLPRSLRLDFSLAQPFGRSADLRTITPM